MPDGIDYMLKRKYAMAMVTASNGRVSATVRDAILNSGTSLYRIAKEVGLSESVLSRFMSGKSGLTLRTVDQLAEALGIETTIGIQRIPPDVARIARPLTAADPTSSKKLATDWETIAAGCAATAHHHLRSPRGIYALPWSGPEEVLVFYNREPPEDAELKTREVDGLRSRLKSNGVRELSFAAYPDQKRMLSYAMLIEGAESRLKEVADELAVVVRPNWYRPIPFEENVRKLLAAQNKRASRSKRARSGKT